MKLKTLSLFVLVSAVITFAAFPISAQKSAGQNVEIAKANAERDERLAKLNKSVVGNIFYENLMSTEKTRWELTQFDYVDSTTVLAPGSVKLTLLRFKNGKQEILISIVEFRSAEAAKLPLDTPISYGRIESSQEFGDEGRKGYGDKGLTGLSFRQGRFFVSISGDGEKTANRFAKYASEAIAGH